MSALLENLRAALVDSLSQGTWQQIESDHQRVQLPWREDLNPGRGKPKYVERVLIELSEDELLALGKRFIDIFPKNCIAVQDALWWIDADGKAEVSELTRLALADAFDGRKLHPECSPDDFMKLFAPPTDGSIAFGYSPESALYAQQDIGLLALLGGQPPPPQRSSHRALLDAYGFNGWPDKRVFQFLEHLVHPRVRQGEEQREWVELVNQTIAVDGYHLVETGTISGRPVFSVHRMTRGVQGQPKNLIFASTGPKPELGFSDAINNDIVILRNEEHCLVYSERIGDEGLRWEDLVAWWAALHDETPKAREIRKALGRRLLASLGSPAEKRFFEAYFRTFATMLGQNLPALVPQVYLHYDPLTFRQLQARSEGKRFTIQRMDFLMLLPERVRIVLEIDGQQHYATGTQDSSRPSPRTYAETVKADRRLRLVGYEVYRFGGYEFRDDTSAEDTVREFFSELFRRHRLLP